jgi:hypothetical protein
LVVTDIRGVLPDFMMSLNRSLAMSIKQLRDWDEVVWEPNVPYSAVEFGGPSEILDKVAYTVLNPVSAGLVRRPERWPGVLSTLEKLQQGALTAERPRVWFKDKAPKKRPARIPAPYVARHCGAEVRPYDATGNDRPFPAFVARTTTSQAGEEAQLRQTHRCLPRAGFCVLIA